MKPRAWKWRKSRQWPPCFSSYLFVQAIQIVYFYGLHSVYSKYSLECSFNLCGLQARETKNETWIQIWLWPFAVLLLVDFWCARPVRRIKPVVWCWQLCRPPAPIPPLAPPTAPIGKVDYRPLAEGRVEKAIAYCLKSYQLFKLPWLIDLLRLLFASFCCFRLKVFLALAAFFSIALKSKKRLTYGITFFSVLNYGYPTRVLQSNGLIRMPSTTFALKISCLTFGSISLFQLIGN